MTTRKGFSRSRGTRAETHGSRERRRPRGVASVLLLAALVLSLLLLLLLQMSYREERERSGRTTTLQQQHEQQHEQQQQTTVSFDLNGAVEESLEKHGTVESTGERSRGSDDFFEAGKKQKDWGKAGGGMSPFHKNERVEKAKTYERELDT